jgi:hypothetical protein
VKSPTYTLTGNAIEPPSGDTPHTASATLYGASVQIHVDNAMALSTDAGACAKFGVVLDLENGGNYQLQLMESTSGTIRKGAKQFYNGNRLRRSQPVTLDSAPPVATNNFLALRILAANCYQKHTSSSAVADFGFSGIDPAKDVYAPTSLKSAYVRSISMSLARPTT